MAVYRESNKTYRVDYKLKTENGTWKHICKRGFASMKEAKAWEKASKLTPIEEPVAPLYTFDYIFAMWLGSLQVSETSSIRYKAHVDARFNTLRTKPVSKITKGDLMEWRNWLVHADYATRTKNATITLIKSVFKFGADMYDLPNPSGCLKRLKQTDEELLKEMTVWTPEEFDRFISCVADNTYHLFFEFLFWTGCRRGEAIAVQKNNLDNGWVTIRYSQRYNKEGLKPTKTKQTRKIKLDDQLWNDLQPLLEAEGCYLFGGKEGLPPIGIDRIFKKAIEESGVTPIRIHDLRHSHATWLINNGVNIVAVSKRLGHATIEQTLKTYTHLLETSDQQMMEKINSYREGNLREKIPQGENLEKVSTSEDSAYLRQKLKELIQEQYPTSRFPSSAPDTKKAHK